MINVSVTSDLNIYQLKPATNDEGQVTGVWASGKNGSAYLSREVLEIALGVCEENYVWNKES